MIPLIKVFSHPRSGTHFVEAFLAENFYKDDDLSIPEVEWGHWSNRKINKEGNKYGKLFGNHRFPDKALQKHDGPALYIFRDGRAVAYSIWKTNNFLKKEMPFSEFLHTPLDWYGSPGTKTTRNLTVAEHWALHVSSWHEVSRKNLILVRYEDLLDNPNRVAKKLCRKFNFLIMPKTINPIKEAVGLLPNKAAVDSWKEVFSESDEALFMSEAKNAKFAFYNSGLKFNKFWN